MNKREEREWRELVERGYLTPYELRSLNKIPETVNISLVVGESGAEYMSFTTGSYYRDTYIRESEDTSVPALKIVECSYCHRPNQIQNEVCRSCGAVLPIR